MVLTLLARAGLTSSKGLARKRKYAIVFSFSGAAIIFRCNKSGGFKLYLSLYFANINL